MIKLSLLLFLAASCYIANGAAEGSYFSSSISDCQDLLHLFDYTLNPSAEEGDIIDATPYGAATEQEYETVTCSFPGTCPDGVTRNTCTWLRFLTFLCDADTSPGEIQYTVVTNSLPNHCYYAESNGPLGSQTEWNAYAWTGLFNLAIKDMHAYDPSSDMPFYYTEITGQSGLNTQLCDDQWAKHDNIDDFVLYSEGFIVESSTPGGSIPAWELDSEDFPLLRLPDSDSIVGVALNGVLLFTGTSDYGYDAFFPQSYGNRRSPRAIETDVCLGSSRTYSTYRYHMFSPCIYDIPLQKVAAPCSSEDYPVCAEDVRSHALEHVPANLKTLTPIGIAKDGRIIYGPFKTDGTIWQPCDVDVCNGVKFSNHYGYVSTMFHPYFVGCWGPGNKPVKLSQECSSNPRRCGSGASSLYQSLFAVMLAFVAVFAAAL